MGHMIFNLMNYTKKVLGNIETLPKLNFILYFIDSKCISSPSLSEICDEYDSFFNLVSKYYVPTYI